MPFNVTTILNQLLSGDVLGAIDAMWRSTLNLGAVIYAFPFLAVLGVIYIKTGDVTVPTILSILFGFGFATVLPIEAKWLAGLFVALALTGTLYKLLHKRSV